MEFPVRSVAKGFPVQPAVIKGDFLPGDKNNILGGPPDAQIIEQSRLLLGLHRFVGNPIFTEPRPDVVEKKNCPPMLINMESGKPYVIGGAEWNKTYVSQPVILTLIQQAIAGNPISLVSQPIRVIQNESEVHAFYCIPEAWTLGLLNKLGFNATGCREVTRERTEELPDPANEDDRLRLDATLTWCVVRDGTCIVNYSLVGMEFKAYGGNADDNWLWDSSFAENIQGQLIKYAKTLKIYEIHCYDGYYWTQIQFSREGYDRPAKVFRGDLYMSVAALLTSYLSAWLEKEFEMSKFPNARILAQGHIRSGTGPVLTFWKEEDGCWYYSASGLKVSPEDLDKIVV